MQYYVIGPDGNKYGPADVPTLKTWVAENRLTPESMLEDFNTGQRMPASAVPGLIEGQPTASAQPGPAMGAASPYSQAPSPGGTVYNPNANPSDNGQGELTLAWVFGVLTLICCGPIFGPLAIWKANQAAAKGNAGAKAAKTFAIVMIVLWICAFIYRIIAVYSAMQNGGLAPGSTPFGQ